MAFSRYVLFRKSSTLDVWLGSEYTPDSICLSWLFLRENNTNLPILHNAGIIGLPSFAKLRALRAFASYLPYLRALCALLTYLKYGPYLRALKSF